MSDCQGCESLMREMDRMATEIDRLRAGLVLAAPEITEVEEVRHIPEGQDWLAQSWTDGKRTVHTTIPPKHAPNGSIEYDTVGAKELAERMLAAPKISEARAERAAIRVRKHIMYGSGGWTYESVARAALADKGGE